jgi:hypothetical protein
MNPFLEIPVCLRGKADDPDQPEKVVNGRLLPGEIAFHYPGYNWGSVLVLKSGHSILTTLSSEQIDAARIAYEEIQRKNPKNKSNVTVSPDQPTKK